MGKSKFHSEYLEYRKEIIDKYIKNGKISKSMLIKVMNEAYDYGVWANERKYNHRSYLPCSSSLFADCNGY